MHPRLEARQNPSVFEPDGYFYFQNEALPGWLLGMASGQEPNNAVLNVSDTTYSSSNWQLFYQSGVYFIRNYDYNADWQLGVESSLSAPRMLRRSGALGHQWTITEVEDREGVYTLSNRLWGSEYKLGISTATRDTLPAMYPSEAETRWYISINLSGPTRAVKDGKMLEEVEDFETASSLSSSRSSSLTFSTSITSQPTTTTTSLPTKSSTLSDPTPKSEKSGIGAGPIAGIAVGGVLALAAIILCIWYLLARRQKNGPKYNVNPMISTKKSAELEVYEQRVELADRTSIREKDGTPIGSDRVDDSIQICKQREGNDIWG